MTTKAETFIIATSLLTVFSPALYGVLGSAGFYVHEVIQDPDSFNWKTLLAYCFLGFVVGLMVYNITLDLTGHSYPGLLIACGFSVRRIADIAEKYIGLKLKLPNNK